MKKVMVKVHGRKVTYSDPSVDVIGGDTITWRLDQKPWLPFAIVIKAIDSPLDWNFRVAKKGGTIVGRVRKNAAPGLYRYAFIACAGPALVVDDPDIIVHRPGGGN